MAIRIEAPLNVRVAQEVQISWHRKIECDHSKGSEQSRLQKKQATTQLVQNGFGGLGLAVLAVNWRRLLFWPALRLRQRIFRCPAVFLEPAGILCHRGRGAC